jgi:hypothetical protein
VPEQLAIREHVAESAVEAHHDESTRDTPAVLGIDHDPFDSRREADGEDDAGGLEEGQREGHGREQRPPVSDPQRCSTHVHLPPDSPEESSEILRVESPSTSAGPNLSTVVTIGRKFADLRLGISDGLKAAPDPVEETP